MCLRTFLLAASFLVLAAPSKADTTYTYTGNNFTTTYGLFTNSTAITGSITLSGPLPANLGTPGATASVSPLTIIAYSFTDGVDTITNSSPDPGSPIFTVTTDASGNIIAWNYDFSLFSGPDIFGSYGDHGFGYVGNDGALDATGDYGGNSDPGTWALTSGSGPTLTPEPGTIALLSTGLAAIATMQRRRIRKA